MAEDSPEAKPTVLSDLDWKVNEELNGSRMAFLDQTRMDPTLLSRASLSLLSLTVDGEGDSPRN